MEPLPPPSVDPILRVDDLPPVTERLETATRGIRLRGDDPPLEPASLPAPRLAA